MPSYPGPYQVEIEYASPSRAHTMRLDLQLDSSPAAGTDLSTLNALTRGGGTVGLTSAVGSFINLIQPFYSNTVSFTAFTLWKFTAGTYERQYIGTAAIGLAGTNVIGPTPAHYIIWTFRNAGGGTSRVTLLEDSANANTKLPYSSMGIESKALVDFVVSTSNWIYGRDNTYPVASLFESQGQNEAVWRKIYRP